MRGSSVLAVIVIVAAGLAFIVGIGLFGTSKLNDVTKPTGGGSGSGCVLADEFFRDTTIADDPEATYSQLVAKYPKTAGVKDKVLQILSEGKRRSINPAMPLAIWNGEQEFDNPEKAFGYGFRDSNTKEENDKWRHWDKQLEGVYKVLGDAIENKGNYTNPNGANVYTRFFYNYTTAMRNSYVESNGTWDSSNAAVAKRLAVLQLLVTAQVKCTSAGGVWVGSAEGVFDPTSTGYSGVPLYNQGDPRYKTAQIYPKKGFSKWGCCPTSASMVIRSYGVAVDPIIVGKFTIEKGFYRGNGTIHGAPWLKALGETYKLPNQEVISLSPGQNWDKVISHLQQRHPLIIRGKGAKPFSQNGHCVVAVSYNPVTKSIYIQNPARGLGSGEFPIDSLKSFATVAYYIGK